MRTFCILAFILLSGIQLRAEMNVKEFLTILSADDSTMTQTVKGYIEGLGEGMQASAIAADKAPLFCAPKPNLGVDVYTSILQRMIKDYAETVSVEELGNTQVSTLLLVGLKRAYPCKQQ
jgi:hypothetical protein